MFYFLNLYKFHIHHLHTSHKAPYLPPPPPPPLFSISLGMAVIQMKNNGYAEFGGGGGANKMH